KRERPPALANRGPRRKGQCRVSAPTASLLRLLHGLAMQREIETVALYLFGDSQADDHVDDLEDDQRHDGIVEEHDADALELVENLAGIAFDQARGATVLVDREHAGEQRADDAADRVDAEAVQRVVDAVHALEAGDAPVAEHAGGDADDHRADRADEARG